MTSTPPHLINGFKLLEQVGAMEYIDRSVRGEGNTYEQIVQDLSLLHVDTKELYFQGVSWENIDLFSGDITSLIPYYSHRMKLWQQANEGKLVLTEILEVSVITPRLRKIILEEAYRGE